MKYLFSFLLLTALISCNDTNNDGPSGSDDGSTAKAPKVKGTLYLQSSIVGGLQMYWLWLGDNGTFIQDPTNGVNPANYEQEKIDNPLRVGHYTKEGNMINATYENGRTEKWPMEYEGNRLSTINGLYIMEPESMPSGYKIIGSYSASAFLANVGNISTFAFKDDGTFDMEGQGFVRTEDVSATATANRGGTYQVNGNTLFMNFDNGEKSVSVIGVYKTEGLNFLVINNKFFKNVN